MVKIDELTDEKGKYSPRKIAEFLTDQYKIVTTRDSKEVYVYNDGYYHEKGDWFVKERVQKTCRDIKRHYVKEVVEKVKTWTSENRGEFNPKKYIDLKNGLYNIEEWGFEPHSPDIIYTTQLPFKYNPEAACPNFKEFLRDITRSKGDREIIQEMFGYALYRSYPYRKAFILWGEGGNGKTILLTVLERLLGKENICNVSLQDIVYNRFSTAELYGKLADINADLPSAALKHTGDFKKATGGDRLKGEKKHQDPFYFRNCAKLIYACNRLPAVRNPTPAFWQRWVVLEFPYEFKKSGYKDNKMIKEKEDRDELLERISNKKELSGILNWAIEGLKRIKESSGFSEVESVERTKIKWYKRSSPIFAFVNLMLDYKPGAWETRNEVYEAYSDYCEGLGMSPEIKSQVSKKINRLSEAEFGRKRIDGKETKIWKNVKLRESPKELGEKKEQKEVTDFGKLRNSILSYLEEPRHLSKIMKHFKGQGYNSEEIDQVVHSLFKEEGAIMEIQDGVFKAVK